jgi:hypothetical protein
VDSLWIPVENGQFCLTTPITLWLFQRADFNDLSVKQRRRGSLPFEAFLIHGEGAFFMAGWQSSDWGHRR